MPKAKPKPKPKPKQFPEEQIRTILKAVYQSGWKQNKQDPTTKPFQMGIEQALKAIKEL